MVRSAGVDRDRSQSLFRGQRFVESCLALKHQEVSLGRVGTGCGAVRDPFAQHFFRRVEMKHDEGNGMPVREQAEALALGQLEKCRVDNRRIARLFVVLSRMGDNISKYGIENLPRDIRRVTYLS